MKIHYLQHVPYIGSGIIQTWAEARNCRISSTYLPEGQKLPNPASIDALVVLGGALSVYDEENNPWLEKEKKFIEKCIHLNKKVLGISFGAQLIASALGANVYTNKIKEIGWYQIGWNSCAWSNPIFNFVPCRQMVLHWIKDTFDLPRGATRLASSRCCKNQAFVYNDHVVGLQFHLEMERDDLEQYVDHNREVLKERGRYIQSAEHILDRPDYMNANHRILVQLLERFFLERFRKEPENLTADIHC